MKRPYQQSALLAVFLFSLFIAADSPQLAAAAEKGPIKLGFIGPLTGSRAQVGADMVAGFKMRLEEAGFTAAGRKIELISEDEKTPTESVATVRKLINHDKVAYIAGFFGSNAAYAVTPPLRGSECSPYGHGM